MSGSINQLEAPPADVGLMLRAHAELRCLSREVIPVLREVEAPDELPTEQLGAAVAYLEVTWMEARRRASETDCARDELAAVSERLLAAAGAEEGLGPLHDGACRYHDAVRALREAVSRRVALALASFEPEPVLVAEADPLSSV